MAFKPAPGHLAFLITAVLFILSAAYSYLRWYRRLREKHDVDPGSWALGIYAGAWAIACCVMLQMVWDPIRLIFERMPDMHLSVWETVQFISVQLVLTLLIWFLVMRIILFLFKWTQTPVELPTQIKEGHVAPVVVLAVALVLGSWLLAETLPHLLSGFLPYPAIPLFR